jgi:hypothetical protein
MKGVLLIKQTRKPRPSVVTLIPKVPPATK